MALIKCPECGNEVSDKAKACPKCGYLIGEININLSEKLVGVSVNDSIVLYFNEQVLEIEQYGKCLVKDSLENFSIMDVEKNSKPAYLISHSSLIKPLVITKATNVEKLAQLKSYLEKYTVKKVVPATVIGKKNKNQIVCPKCKSINIAYMGAETIGAREAKTKTETSLNLNPLKPFTLFNHREKVVKKGCTGYGVDRWHCKDCGNIFNR